MQQSIQMVDLKGQYQKIKSTVDAAIQRVIDDTAFINGQEVKQFEQQLANNLNAKHVIGCANGTDALQIAMQALGLEPGDEVIVPAFTYVATAEVIALLRLTPVLVDVDPETFNITAALIEPAITPKTKAIVPVHLFGQCADMEAILQLANKYNLYVIEDTAQAIGADYTFADGSIRKAGTMGHIGCTSFFPSKNLGCYGDGGALYTNDDALAQRIRMVANHGQAKKYHHEIVGVNSRLDTLQAAVLTIKLPELDNYTKARNRAAAFYDEHLGYIDGIQIPVRQTNSTHVFHQYTLQIKMGRRDELKEFLQTNGIPSMIYYPIPLHEQIAYKHEKYPKGVFPIAERLSDTVLSLPMHTELNEEQLSFITSKIKEFFS